MHVKVYCAQCGDFTLVWNHNLLVMSVLVLQIIHCCKLVSVKVLRLTFTRSLRLRRDYFWTSVDGIGYHVVLCKFLSDFTDFIEMVWIKEMIRIKWLTFVFDIR